MAGSGLGDGHGNHGIKLPHGRDCYGSRESAILYFYGKWSQHSSEMMLHLIGRHEHDPPPEVIALVQSRFCEPARALLLSRQDQDEPHPPREAAAEAVDYHPAGPAAPVEVHNDGLDNRVEFGCQAAGAGKLVLE